jgi:hypothetical protein
MRQVLPLFSVPLLVSAAAVAVGCAGRGADTVSVLSDPPPDFKGIETSARKFLTATDPAERARCVQGGEELRDEMARYYADRPPVRDVRIEAAKLRDARNAVVVAVVNPGDGERRVVLSLTKCDQAWLVDWKTTVALAK